MNTTEKLRVIITGVTGMVGEGVLLECLKDARVEAVLIISRKPAGFEHPKLKCIVHKDFSDISILENEVKNYNACFFCAGVTSIGKNEETFNHLTYDLTIGFATTLSKMNPGLVFCYVSGSGTDSSEQGKVMWARVKGKTENRLKKLNFGAVYNFRPGYMQPVSGSKYTIRAYYLFTWMYPILKLLFPGFVCRLAEVGQAMIRVATEGYSKSEIEVREIVKLA